MPIARSIYRGNRATFSQGLFPLSVSADTRFLKSPSGAAFPLLARTSWNIVCLTPSELTTYLDDCAAKGFTGIEMAMIHADTRGTLSPKANGGASLPFSTLLGGGSYAGTGTPDFTTPVEAFWAHVDLVMSMCEARGIAVLAFPGYAGFQGGSQGWMAQMSSNGSTKMTTYGDFIGNRYKLTKNIVWMMGGDYGTAPNAFSGAEETIEAALFNALLGTSGLISTQVCAEWDSDSISADQATFTSQQTMQGAYSHSGEISTQMRRAYAASPTKPGFLVESAYDQEGPDGTNVNSQATQPTRRFIWRGLLDGIAGYIQGNGYIWTFNAGEWNNSTHLNSTGQQDLARLNAFYKSIAWSRLVPHGLGSIGTLITANRGTVDLDNYVAAAATPLGDLLVAYCGPSSGDPTIDMTKMRGSTTARWFDPTNASYQTISGSPFANTGTRNFAKPGNNSAAEGDWVLRLDA